MLHMSLISFTHPIINSSKRPPAKECCARWKCVWKMQNTSEETLPYTQSYLISESRTHIYQYAFGLFYFKVISNTLRQPDLILFHFTYNTHFSILFRWPNMNVNTSALTRFFKNWLLSTSKREESERMVLNEEKEFCFYGFRFGGLWSWRLFFTTNQQSNCLCKKRFCELKVNKKLVLNLIFLPKHYLKKTKFLMKLYFS